MAAAAHERPGHPTREGLTDLVHGFYADVRADAQLGRCSTAPLARCWDTHLERMVEFWSTVALGTRSFKGDVFGKAHGRGRRRARSISPSGCACGASTPSACSPRWRGLQTVAHGIARNLFRGFSADACWLAGAQRRQQPA